ncbi:hypothetical protein CAEBREN_23963 [Caenorhabditis brenneri]|uniref:Uncharacterized protein n=1 Tax=Caenorhabditis brenneri TaxID=135651 RepID=G0NIP0_CAEBE|nr:hypothetical protein CAEBREN_23963 [Caenorhabditis brenneri]
MLLIRIPAKNFDNLNSAKNFENLNSRQKF